MIRQRLNYALRLTLLGPILMIFVDIGKAADLEVIFAKALKELPRRLLIVIPEWKERTFYDLHEYLAWVV